ncbi:hypothetical protein DBV33_09465 [Pseudomonas fluorescens]|nr:hypothetical protein DBV33_09465 [Pseudomonas fluorescens]
MGGADRPSRRGGDCSPLRELLLEGMSGIGRLAAGSRDLIVPMLRVGMHPVTLSVTVDAERPWRRYHAERGNDHEREVSPQLPEYAQTTPEQTPPALQPTPSRRAP